MAESKDLIDIHKAIGGMAADIKHILGDIAEMKASAAADKRDASEKRGEIYGRIADAIEQARKAHSEAEAAKSAALATQQQIATEVLPVTEEVKRWKIAGVTTIAIVGFGAASIGFFFKMIWDTFSAWIFR